MKHAEIAEAIEYCNRKSEDLDFFREEDIFKLVYQEIDVFISDDILEVKKFLEGLNTYEWHKYIYDRHKREERPKYKFTMHDAVKMISVFAGDTSEDSIKNFVVEYLKDRE